VWSITPGFGLNPSAAFSGNGALFLDDQYFAPESFTNVASRRLESPSVNLSTSTSPYVRFKMFFANASNQAYPVKIMASLDNGVTWKTISDVQPNFSFVGTATAATPWEQINVKIPTAYRTANAKFAIQRSNSWSSNALYIDNFSIEEFTPTTITSAASGTWSSAATWVGGVVPNADNNVIIATGHTVSLDQNIARCQTLGIDGTLNHSATTTTQILQTFDDVSISASGTYLGGSGTIGKFTYIGGSLTNAGTLNVSQSTTASLYFNGGAPASFTNLGTITNGFISVIYTANTAGFSFASPLTVRNNFFLVDGPVSPNGNLTIGLSGNAVTITRNALSYFDSRPLFPSLGGTVTRSIVYGGGTNGNSTYGPLNRDTIFTGFELDTTTGTRLILGTLSINTHGFVKLTSPLQLGNVTVGGALIMSRGIMFTDDTNLLTIFNLGNGAASLAPSAAAVPTSHGSYIIGPVRFNRPASGTAAINIPFGVGADLNGITPNNNVAKSFILSAGAGWASQTLTFKLINTAPSGTAPAANVLGNRYLTVDLNGGPDLPATSALTFPAMNYTLGTGANTDNLFGTQDQLRVLQNTTPTGTTWVERSTATGVGALVNNTNYTRTTATVAPGPISPVAVNGGVFAIGTTAPRMVVDSVMVTRDLSTISLGTLNQAIIRVAVWATGVIPLKLTNATFNTTGTTNVADITSARLFFTGSSDALLTTNQIGTSIATPSGAMPFNGDVTLSAGANYFWLVYDISGSATLGNTIAADLTAITIGGVTSNPTNPPAGGRVLSAPMTFVSATANQTVFTKVNAPSTNNRILDVVITMSPSGAPIALTQMDLSTNGGNNPLTNISNAKLYYTGSSNTFSTSNLVGTTIAPNGAFSITGNASLVNGVNHFWLTYDIPAGAIPGDSVDVELVAVTVGTSQAAAFAPAGVRYIKAAYCVASNASGCGTDFIGRVRLGSLDNVSGCTATNGTYTDYTGLTAPQLIAGIPYTLSITYGSHASQFGWAWVDWNDDGDFADAGESLGNQFPANAGANGTSTITFTPPCNVPAGTYRLRIRGGHDSQILGTQHCGAAVDGWGEIEDYTIQVIPGNPSHLASQAIQFTGTASAGVTDRNILRIPIKVIASPCVPAVITQFNFRTIGTTSNADISSAKLYKTGSSAVFSTANLVGTVASPSTNFSFILTDTANNDTNNYWLTYDINGAAANGNVVDAAIDSIQLFGSWVIPTNNNPTGSVLISTPMTYISSTVEHRNTTKVGLASTNNDLLRLRVITSSIGAPI
ncbi:MAG: hypothetical protein EAY81_01660, partial [Bacteroidetes bacterium]